MSSVKPFSLGDVRDFEAVIGVDEVGRGALCGPVVVAAVWFDPTFFPSDIFVQLDDSKRLTARKREELARGILCNAHTAVAASSVTMIDRVGILRATLDAMGRAVLRLRIQAPILIDGRDVPAGLIFPARAIIGGDGKVPQIAAASILAKTCRDRLMSKLSTRYNGYCWEHNMGYGTTKHLEGLATHGITAHHRLTFKPILQHRFDFSTMDRECITNTSPTIS
jgi:ribonuclease HII